MPNTYHPAEVPRDIWGKLDAETVVRYGIEQQPGFETHFIRLAGDRRLAAEVGGPIGGKPVIWHHGTPGSRIELPISDEDLHRLNIRLYKFDRPGYGFSDSANPLLRSPMDVAEDTMAMIRYFGIDISQGLGGLCRSGGTIYGMGLAARWPGLVERLALLVPIAPFSQMGDLWFKGMGHFNTEIFKALLQTPPNAAPVLERLSQIALATCNQRPGVLNALGSEGPQGSDARYRTVAAISHAAGLRAGIAGWAADLFANRDWQFDPRVLGRGRTGAPAKILLGYSGNDVHTPSEQSKWLAQNITGAEVRINPEGSHFTAYGDMHEALEFLVASD